MKAVALITVKLGDLIRRCIVYQANRTSFEKATTDPHLSLLERFPSDISYGSHVGNSLDNWMVFMNLPSMTNLHQDNI
jgi:hypothetical protein